MDRQGQAGRVGQLLDVSGYAIRRSSDIQAPHQRAVRLIFAGGNVSGSGAGRVKMAVDEHAGRYVGAVIDRPVAGGDFGAIAGVFAGGNVIGSISYCINISVVVNGDIVSKTSKRSRP